MKSKVVAILETRAGAHLAELVVRRGGTPLLAPALEEVPDIDPQAVRSLLAQWRVQPFKICIFQTGVGTRALFAATDAANLSAELQERLAASTVVVRGPKPVGELSARGVRIDIRAASPFTTERVLDALAHVPVAGASILVQRYGETNQALSRGTEIPRRHGAGDRHIPLGAARRHAAAVEASRGAWHAGASMPWSLPARFKSIIFIRWPRRPEVRRIWRRISIVRLLPRSVRFARAPCATMASSRHSRPVRQSWGP